MAGIGTRLAGAKASNGGGQSFVEGVYPVVAIDALKNFQSQQGDGEVVVIECTVLESEVESVKPGMSRSVVYMLDKHQPAEGNAKAAIAALYGHVDPEAVTEDEIAAAFAPANPLRNTLVRVDTHTITTKKNKVRFPVSHFTRLPEEAQAVAEKYRAQVLAAKK